jgi:hypothetical protein
MMYKSLEKEKLTKNIAIVGNANFSFNQSDRIDKCDFVLRFNECKNFGLNCGTKTDAICVTNTGIPADRMVNYPVAKARGLRKQALKSCENKISRL